MKKAASIAWGLVFSWCLFFSGVGLMATGACNSAPPELPAAQIHRKQLLRQEPQAGQAAPIIYDVRSPVEAAFDACNGRCGKAVAKPKPQPHLLGASTSVPIIPPAWGVGQWEIDGQNNSGCASNSNSGTSATCVGGCAGSVCTSGVGPLRDCQELLTHRWGTYSPRLQQQTIIEWTSSASSTADECYFNPYQENGTLILRGVPTTQCVGTAAGRVVKAHATNTLLSFTDGSGGFGAACAGHIAQDSYALNTTRGSGAFIKSFAANVSTMSQPLPTFTLPWNGTDPNEDDTWANGDSVTIETFPTVYIGSLSNILSDSPNSGVNTVYVQHLNIQPSANTGLLTAANQGNVYLTESVIGREIVINGIGVQGLNSDATANIVGIANAPNFRSPNGGWKAGIIRQSILAGASLYFDAGAIITATSSLVFQAQSAQLNDIYIDTNISLLVSGNNVASAYPGNTAPFIWGPGTLSVSPPGYLIINANTSVPTLFVSTIDIDGLNTACSVSNVSGAVWNCNISITPAHIDAAFGVAGFGGAAISPLGGSILTLSAPY